MKDDNNQILIIHDRLWEIDKRLDVLERVDLENDEESESPTNIILWIEEIAKSPLIRNFTIQGALLASAWEFAESTLDKIPLPLQIITLILIIGGSVWVIAKVIEKIMNR